MATTKDEETSKQKLDEKIVVAKEVTRGDVLAAYIKGKNYYDLARMYFDSDSEQALERVRNIVEADSEE
jgi:hypothetical protein